MVLCSFGSVDTQKWVGSPTLPFWDVWRYSCTKTKGIHAFPLHQRKSQVDYIQILENGNVFLHVLEILHVVHNGTSFVWLETDLPPKSFSSSFSNEKGRRNFHSACLIPGTLTISLPANEPWIKESKASKVYLSWIAPFWDCYPKWSQVEPSTDTLKVLYQGKKKEQKEC